MAIDEHWSDRNARTATAVEVCKVLDALSALAVDLSCHCDVPPETLILSAQKSRDACAAIDEGVAALKKLLQICVAAGGEAVPTEGRRQPDAGEK